MAPVSRVLFENNIRQGSHGALDSILELLQMIVRAAREIGKSYLVDEF